MPDQENNQILRIVSRMAIGGVQRGILETLGRADHHRFDYALLCTKKAGTWAEAVRELGVRVEVQKTLPPWDPYQILRLSWRIRRLCPDVVHVHMAPLVIPGVMAARLAGVPWRRIVVQHHSNYERFWFEQENAFLRRWEWALTRRVGALIAVSGPAARASERAIGMAEGSFEVIANGVNLGRFQEAEAYDPRADWGLEPDTPVVAHVSRYLETKNIEQFIEAAGRVTARWPEFGGGRPLPAFPVIGGGPEHYRKIYEAKIAEVKQVVPQTRVWLEGSRDDLPRIYKCIDVGVLATENEGCPNVILEYLAAGLPIVSNSIEPVAEIVTHEQEALLSRPRDAGALAENIARVLCDAGMARRLAENARALSERYDWQRTIDGYEAIYRRLLES